MLYALLIALIAIAYAIVRTRETFMIKWGNPFNDEDAISIGREGKGTRLFGITPDTCPCEKPEIDAGLCYERCEGGYHGVGPVCWADTKDVGIGRIPDMHGCDHYLSQESWRRCRDDGTSLWEDFGCEPTYCDGNWDWSDGGFCHTKCNGCGCIKKNLFQRQYCADGGDLVAALCYNKCPADLPDRVPGMPYLCYKGTRGLSYGRGVGDVPSIFKFGGCKAS